MRRSLTPGLIMAVYLLSAVSPDFSGKVVSIIDGDTIDVLHDGKAERIRLYGIDCPEKGQAYGKRAKEYTARLAFGKKVKVKVKGRDRYGRMIGEVILPGGRNLNHKLVAAGLAWWYQKYAPDDKTLQALEAKARREKRGLWQDPNPIPPWEWRKARREKSG